MSVKLELTRSLLAHLSESSRPSECEAMRSWWYNIRTQGGFRLTDVGYLMLRHAVDLESYSYALEKDTIFNLSMLLKLDQTLKAPYYLEKNKHRVNHIIFFHSKEAMMAKLYGDIDRFLTNYK